MLIKPERAVPRAAVCELPRCMAHRVDGGHGQAVIELSQGHLHGHGLCARGAQAPLPSCVRACNNI